MSSGVALILEYFPDLTPIQQKQFALLGDLYEDWNSKINVISRKDMEHFYERHVLHSLGIAKVIQFKPDTVVLDIGTGGGFPTVPLAILFPDVMFLAVDAVGKKIKVLNAVVEELGLENVEGRHARAEEFKMQFDFIISRAVTALPKFMTYTKGKISKKKFNDLPNGLLYLKGGDFHEELNSLKTKQKPSLFNLGDHFKGEFFETKKVVFIPM